MRSALRVFRAAQALYRLSFPGADGLRLERQSFSIDRRTFVAIRHGVRSEAQRFGLAGDVIFTLLEPARRCWAKLIVAGRITPDAVGARQFFVRHWARSPNLRVMDQPVDLGTGYTKCCGRPGAVIMPSEAEAFRLPP